MAKNKAIKPEPNPDGMDAFRETGRSFGYPECCIEFFCTTWMRVIEGDEVVRFSSRRDQPLSPIYAANGRWASGKDGYIPCPACLGELLQKKFDKLYGPKKRSRTKK